MNVSEALEARRSVRYFGDREVPEETLRSIVKDAQWAPSWANAQPWKVYIATGSRALEIRENHRGIAEPGLKGHSDLAAGHREDWGERACANMARLGSEVMGFLDDDGNQIADCQRDLFDAPAIVYLTMHKGTRFNSRPLTRAASDNAGTAKRFNHEFCRTDLVMTGTTSFSSLVKGQNVRSHLYDNLGR